ncbi:4Fe-4S dicluster domain-containing protein [Buttiauxella gaviniae]|uniref:4Fe-4S dicluster domain-containing protein n=1 Tax=Buttiauxella gaviniae TaxID=82990 RepID=A0ABV3P0B4_9ENTR
MTFSALDARPVIGRACLHRQLRSSRCEACLNACPLGAITLEEDRIQLDADSCTSCGNCLFVCPTAAIENLPAPTRSISGSTLVGPLSVVPPTVEELLAWHSEQGIRSVETDPLTSPGWLMAIAALNLRLKQLGEPLWFIVPPEEKAINSGRRRWLQIRKKEVLTAGISAPSAFNKSSFTLTLDKNRCYLCGACSRICPKKALEISDENFTVNHANCSGCQACIDVCLPQALQRVENMASEVTQHALTLAQCKTCHHTFRAWSNNVPECPVCQRHGFGMREA